MKPEILFKTHLFPAASETFVVSNVIEAINKGYDVKIVVDRVNPIKRGSQGRIMGKLGIMRLVSKIDQPQGKVQRVFKALQYSLNPILFYYFVKYCLFTSKIKLSAIFLLKFYKEYRTVDIFHIHFAVNATDVSILKGIGYLKGKVLVTFHGFDAHHENELEKEVLINNYKRFYTVWDKVTTNTIFLKDKVKMLGYPDSKIEVVPMAIDLEFYTPKIYPKFIKENEKYKVLSVGRLVSVKGHEYGIKTIKLLVDKGCNIKYTIIGNGLLHEALATLIKELKLENNVVLYGRASQEVIKEVLDQSHLFLMTSVKDDTGREETQGVVSAEAQAMGLPIVGFNSGGVPFTVTKETSILVAQKDIVAMSQAILQILENKEQYRTMSIEARQWASSQFGLPKMVDRYYKDLI